MTLENLKLTQQDTEALVSYVNLVLTKARFPDLSTLEILKFSELTVQMKDLKLKLDNLLDKEPKDGLPTS